MYEFIDVFENAEGMPLPSEALKINGVYIEEEIEGYRTLSVEGREALSPELTTFETGIRDGSSLQGKRFPARTIRITYQLCAKTSEEFRSAYNKLASILNVTDAELIFNDETDKFYTGTPSRIGEVPPGKNAVVGEFDILCLDPFKYSVMEYEAAPDQGTDYAVINYNGTYKSFPTLQAEFYKENEASEDGETVTELTGGGDCGYVAFFNEEEKIIQIGDPDEADGDNAYQKSQTLINHRFESTGAWGSAAKSQWGINRSYEDKIGIDQVGSLNIGVAAYDTPITKSSGEVNILKTTSKADRPYIHYTITASFSNRTANSVKVTFGIHTRLDNQDSFFGIGYGLKATLTVDSVPKTITLKNVNERWTSTTTHSKYITLSFSLLDRECAIHSSFKVERADVTAPGLVHGDAGKLETTSCEDFTIPAYSAKPDWYYLCPDNYGNSTDPCYGVSMTRAIPADAAGVTGAVNCKLSYANKMCCGNLSELGSFGAFLMNGAVIIAGVKIDKVAAGTKATMRFIVNGSVKETMQVDVSPANSLFKNTTSQSVITKIGQTVTFDICGKKKTYKTAAIAKSAVTEVVFTIGRYKKANPLKYNGLYWVKFVKNNCDTWRDIPNKFSANDVVEADCKNGEIYLNGNSAQAYGALGNDWEGFYLTPGINQIGFAYSEWVEAAYAPSFKVKYREVFL